MPEFSGYANQLASHSTDLIYLADMTPGSGSMSNTPSPREAMFCITKATEMNSAPRKNSVNRKGNVRALLHMDEAAYSSGDDLFGPPVRSRAFSTSSEHSDSAATDLRGAGTSNPRKRGSTDAIDYPRRRATIACEVCRGRKSRCDGAKPRCRLCMELNAECVYREPGVKLDAGDKLILERLQRIEGLLQSGLTSPTTTMNLEESLAAVEAHASSPTMSHGTHMSTDEMQVSNGFHANSHAGDQQETIPIIGLGTWRTQTTQTNISTMPKVHSTPALNLLQWPIIRDLVARPYDPQQLLRLEMARAPLQIQPPASVDLANASTYIEAFFARANIWYAIVDPHSWDRTYQTALSRNLHEGVESCMCLLVLALGAASQSSSISALPRDQAPPGMGFFAAAWSMLPQLMTCNTMPAAQCMVLAAAYLFYLVRPLEAWSLLSSTSTKLQLLLHHRSAFSPVPELGERVFWNALLFESDLLSELDLPHFGIVQFEELVGLPSGFDASGGVSAKHDIAPTAAVATGRDEPWYFLAEIALRRLLNRVSHVLYSPRGRCTPLAALQPVVEELEFQLTQWYANLPQGLQFPHATVPQAHAVQTVLRLRYFACRTIIFRPYIHAVFEDARVITDPAVRAGCLAGLEASLRQLEHVSAHRAGHLPYLWQGALSLVSQCLLVMGATRCAELAALLPPPDETDDIIRGVVAEVERLAPLAPSLGLGAEILRKAESRRLGMLGPAGLRY